MSTGIEFKNYKLKALPNKPIPNAVLYIKADGETNISTYITDVNGIPYPLKDIGGSGGSGIQTIINTDGNMSVVGTDNKVINLSTPIKNLINSALQPGSNISQLVNDSEFENSNQLNTRDTNNRNRINHTGNQSISTVTDLQTTLDSKLNLGGYVGTATDFVQKLESQDLVFNSATAIIDVINLTDERSSVSITGLVTDVKSLQIPTEFIRPGKPHYFKNRTVHDIKIWHNAGSGNVKYSFPDSSDLIVKPNEVIEFSLDTYTNKLDLVGNAIGNNSGIIDAPAISGTGNTVITFDQTRYYGKTTQTGDISLSLNTAPNVNKNGRVQVIDIDGTAPYSFTQPLNSVNSNGESFDNTKNNVIYYDIVNDKIIYKIIKSGYNYKRNIVFDNTGSNEAFTNTQFKIVLNSTNFDFSKTKVDGGDIRFFDGNTMLTYFKESYNQTSETGVFYVKLDLPASTFTTISIHYGDLNLTSISDWSQTMDRFKPNLYSGNTKYLLSFDEGNGTSIVNSGSAGGNVTVQNNWATQNNYGFAGSALDFNGTNQNVNIPGLLDVYPDAGEISFSFIARTITGGNRLLSKFNRLGTADPDYGDYFNLFINSSESNRLQIRTDTSAGATSVSSTSSILINTLYKVTIIWGNGAIGLYINGALAGRGIFYKVNGSQQPFKIGSFSDPFTGASNFFFDGTINDFRYTDYSTGQIPSLVHVEAEHKLTKFHIKDKRTKFNAKKDMLITNFPTGDVTNYKSEPFSMFDNGLFKLWYSAGDSYIHYRESTTSLGLKTATDQLVLGGGIGGETGDPSTHSIYKEDGIYYMFYNRLFTDTVYVVNSTDGINWGNKKVAITLPSSGWGSYGLVNTWVVKVNGVYQMFVEAKDPPVNWSIGRATSSTPDGLYTIVDAPINAFKINGIGSSGGVTGWFDGVNYNMFFHANSFPEYVYDQTYFITTADLVNYTTEQTPTIAIVDDITAYDQTSDANIFYHNNKVYLDYSALDNRTPFFAGIIRCEFNGTLEQLKKDLTITIEAEQVG